nr:DUF6527 family protein [Roseisolibacter agri]
MNRRMRIRHEFVEYVPRSLEEGVLYISIPFATAVHCCCCGCGEEVVTPISPTDWSLTFDGETVSLNPSIGNWSFACESHYWIRRNGVQWAESWTAGQIAEGRMRHRAHKESQARAERPVQDVRRGNANGSANRTLLQRIRSWLSRRRDG